MIHIKYCKTEFLLGARRFQILECLETWENPGPIFSNKNSLHRRSTIRWFEFQVVRSTDRLFYGNYQEAWRAPRGFICLWRVHSMGFTLKSFQWKLSAKTVKSDLGKRSFVVYSVFNLLNCTALHRFISPLIQSARQFGKPNLVAGSFEPTHCGIDSVDA